jgi:hypothetical protein
MVSGYLIIKVTAKLGILKIFSPLLTLLTKKEKEAKRKKLLLLLLFLSLFQVPH